MKVIDLLNKIANGEKMPKKIKYDKEEYFWCEQCETYEDQKSKDWLSNIDNLNDEVEILEDTMEEIEELKEYVNYLENQNCIRMAKKINELVRFCNKLNNTTYKAENCMTD